MGLPVVPDPFLIIRQDKTSRWEVPGNSLLMGLTSSCCESVMLVVAG